MSRSRRLFGAMGRDRRERLLLSEKKVCFRFGGQFPAEFEIENRGQRETFSRMGGAPRLAGNDGLCFVSSLAMVKLRHLPAGSLPPVGEPTGVAEKDFPTAYAAMRRGDFQTAATILEATRKSLPPELFDYLLNACPIRDYALEPKITRFY